MRKLPLVLLALLTVAVAGAWAWKSNRSSGPVERTDLIVEPVRRGRLEISLTERGNLESARNTVLPCLVEGEAGTGIIMIVDEGTLVKEGDKLFELDSSRMRDAALQQEIVVTQAEAAMLNAEKAVEIQKKANESLIETAKKNVTLAELDLRMYKEGLYDQERKAIEGEIKLAEENLKRFMDKYKFTQDMIKKGYATQTELEADRIAVEQGKNVLEVGQEKKRLLKDFTKERQTVEKKANFDVFKNDLERAEYTAEAALIQYEADYKSKKLVYQAAKSKHDQLLEQIKVCIQYAPRDGLVVYANTRQQGGRGGPNETALVYEGAKVRERQAIINLPDIANMQVNARIHESKIDPVHKGLQSLIRIDALPGETFHGEVTFVSLAPLSGNFPNQNLKEYATFIKIMDDESKTAALRPGMTAEVEILVDRIESTLQGPITAFVERSGRQFCWVLDSENQTVRREVKTGKSSEIATQLIEDEALYSKGDGVKEGDKLVLNPRTILPKEILKLEEDVPVVTDASGFKPGAVPAAPDATRGPRRGGRGAGGGGSPGEAGAGGEFGGGPGGGGGGRRRGGGGGGGREGGGGNWGGREGGPREAGGGGFAGGGDPAERFAQLDKNSDGKLTADEIPERMREFVNVSQLDANKNDAIDKDEWLKNAQQRSEGQGSPRGAETGGGQ